MKNKRFVSKTYTILPELFNSFTEFCKENHINRSAVIRSLITQYLKEQKK